MDKEKEDEVLGPQFEVCRFSRGDCWADDDLTGAVADTIREDVRSVYFPAEAFIKGVRAFLTNEDERNIPLGEYFLGNGVKRQTRQRSPRQILYGDARHSLALTANPPRGWIDLAELHEFVVGAAARERNKGAFVFDVLRTGALEVTTVTHLAHETETLRAAGKATDKSGRALVFAPAHFNSRAFYHQASLPCGHDFTQQTSSAQ